MSATNVTQGTHQDAEGSSPDPTQGVTLAGVVGANNCNGNVGGGVHMLTYYSGQLPASTGTVTKALDVKAMEGEEQRAQALAFYHFLELLLNDLREHSVLHGTSISARIKYGEGCLWIKNRNSLHRASISYGYWKSTIGSLW